MYLGIDIGSSTSKAVILDEKFNIISFDVKNTGTGTSGPEKAVEAALSKAGISSDLVKFTVATGYGRITYDKADKQITEISCHAMGVTHLMPSARTIVDIGGQDVKVIRLDEYKRVENFAMNDKCAAGTGRFLEVMARILDCSIDMLSELDEHATKEISISNTCTVFAESEVISQLSSGAERENVARGVHHAVAKRVAGLAARIGIEKDVAMTGGVALNSGVLKALEEEMEVKISVVDNPQIIGALGAALYAAHMEDVK
jgi:(R)-2-hydroxyacyl-CoA dehydratese activating ATPase